MLRVRMVSIANFSMAGDETLISLHFAVFSVHQLSLPNGCENTRKPRFSQSADVPPTAGPAGVPAPGPPVLIS